jgi:thiol-disulfide isomerase/thioredoxin
MLIAVSVMPSLSKLSLVAHLAKSVSQSCLCTQKAWRLFVVNSDRLRSRFAQPKDAMSYLLPHLHTGWHVDQAIMSEDDRLVVIRFGRDWDEECMKQDEVLYRIADKCKNFAVFYLVDIDEVPDFNKMYELYDACTGNFI